MAEIGIPKCYQWEDNLGVSINIKNVHTREFPCGPVVKTLCFQCRGHGSDSGAVAKNKYNFKIKKKKKSLGGPVVKNLPCNAGDTDSFPDQKLRSHMPQSYWAHTPQLKSLHAATEDPAWSNEDPACHN